MIRVGPPFPPRGTRWDHKGKTEIERILISCSRNRINFMYFVYVEDGGTKLVLSEKLGEDETSHSMETVNFDYPSEYITRVSGQYTEYPVKHLRSITFYTNKGVYGPFTPGDLARGLVLIDFSYQVAGKFGGFFGSYDKDSIEAIGFYVDPLQKRANQPGEIVVAGLDGHEASGETS